MLSEIHELNCKSLKGLTACECDCQILSIKNNWIEGKYDNHERIKMNKSEFLNTFKTEIKWASEFRAKLGQIELIVDNMELEGGVKFQRTRELIKSLAAQFETDVKK